MRRAAPDFAPLHPGYEDSCECSAGSNDDVVMPGLVPASTSQDIARHQNANDRGKPGHDDKRKA
jgi:hypothetical protein